MIVCAADRKAVVVQLRIALGLVDATDSPHPGCERRRRQRRLPDGAGAQPRHRHGVGLLRGGVRGGDLDRDGVRAHRELDGGARLTAGDRGQRGPLLAHLHRGAGGRHRRGDLQVRPRVPHRRRVRRGGCREGRGRERQRRERARRTRVGRRRQGGQVGVGGGVRVRAHLARVDIQPLGAGTA